MNVIAELNGYKITRQHDGEDGTGMILVQEGSYTHQSFSFDDSGVPTECRKPGALTELAAVNAARRYIANF